MGLSRRRFTREFKLAAVQRLEQGITIAEVAQAMEVNPNVLYRWRKEFREGPGNAFPGHGQRLARVRSRHHPTTLRENPSKITARWTNSVFNRM
jgi:transposase-like protein